MRTRRCRPWLVLVLAVATAGTQAPGAIAQDPAFELRFAAPADAALEPVREVLESAGRFPELIEALNATFRLPSTVVISFEQGDGPLYDPNRQTIVMNYEFVDLIGNLMQDYDPEATADETLVAVLDATEFILFHEVGHAMVDVLGLPVVGREEDGVDSLATVLMVEFMEEPEAAISAALAFDSFALQDEGEIGEGDLWDEHSLDEQRFGAITCWVYGSDPDAFADLVGADWLPEERAVRCPEEYQQQSDSWHRLLQAAEQ